MLTTVVFPSHVCSRIQGFSNVADPRVSWLCCIGTDHNLGIPPPAQFSTGRLRISNFAVGLLNYFFIEPLLTFRVAHPENVAALAAFLTASLVTTRLVSKAREQANAARRDRCNLELLYECAQRLLVLDPLRTEPSKFLEAIMQVFDLKAVCYFDAVNAFVPDLHYLQAA
jgi:Domain of unknown function (DUF4118)